MGSADKTRTLLHIPIVHTEADMGALHDSIRQMTIRKLGREGWERKVKTAHRLSDCSMSYWKGWRFAGWSPVRSARTRSSVWGSR